MTSLPRPRVLTRPSSSATPQHAHHGPFYAAYGAVVIPAPARLVRRNRGDNVEARRGLSLGRDARLPIRLPNRDWRGRPGLPGKLYTRGVMKMMLQSRRLAGMEGRNCFTCAAFSGSWTESTMEGATNRWDMGDVDLG